MKAIYKKGSCQLQTTITNGVCAYTDGKTPEEYLKELGVGYVCIPLEDALNQINAVEEKAFITGWTEISEEDWDYRLGVLPPEKWETVAGVNIFRMSERLVNDITLHCATIGNRYFAAQRRTTCDYNDIANDILQLIGRENHA